jgi:hypothetical protein
VTVATTGTRALGAACVAFVTVPNLGALLGRGEQTDRYDTVVTPPDYAFAIWGPIFASCATDAVLRWRDPAGPTGSDSATVSPLTVAYVLNTVWSVAAQTDRFGLTPGLLVSAAVGTGIAHGRLQRVAQPRRSTVLATGLLLGWTTLASAVNVAADVVRRGAPPQGPAATAVALTGVVGAGTLAGVTAATSRHGAVPVAGAAAWGLVTTAADRRRPRVARVVSGSTAACVAALLASRRSR